MIMHSEELQYTPPTHVPMGTSFCPICEKANSHLVLFSLYSVKSWFQKDLHIIAFRFDLEFYTARQLVHIWDTIRNSLTDDAAVWQNRIL